MKITIGITTYNRINFLKNCLSSILNQGSFNLEILIGNDFVSKPITKEELQFHDERIVIINNTVNLGEINNLNNLLKMSTGDYFIWLADDDELSSFSLLAFFEGIQVSNLASFIIPKTHTGKAFPSDTKEFDRSSFRNIDNQLFLDLYLEGKIPLQGVYILFKTEVLKDWGGIQKLSEGPFYADANLAIKTICSKEQIFYIDYPCVLFRVHSESISNTTDRSLELLSSQEQLIINFCSISRFSNTTTTHFVKKLYINWFIGNFIDVSLRSGKIKPRDIFALFLSITGQERLLNGRTQVLHTLFSKLLKELFNNFKKRTEEFILLKKINSKLKLYFQLEFLLVKILTIFSRKTQSDIALIRLDAIGDYLLFRNFIEEIKKSKKFLNKRITLIGNIAWKEVSEELDKPFVDNFIWIDRNRIWSDKAYRLKLLFRFSTLSFQSVISSAYSRELHFSDSLLRVLNSKHKIGQFGDTTNLSPSIKNFADGFYDQLIRTDEILNFEFIRNLHFFSQLLEQDLQTLPRITSFLKNPLNLEKFSYLIFFIGGSAQFRKWSNQNYIALAKEILARTSTTIVFCGTLNDIDEKTTIDDFHFKNSLNLIGITKSFSDLIPITRDAKCIISNETSMPHLAVSLNVPVFVISNVFGRFTPYPKYITSHYFPIYHDAIKNSKFSLNETSIKYKAFSDSDINTISISQVILEIEKAGILN